MVLEIRVARYSILYSDTCFTAQALVKLMLDLQNKFVDIQPNEFDDQGVPLFEDVYGVFMLLSKNILGKVVSCCPSPNLKIIVFTILGQKVL